MSFKVVIPARYGSTRLPGKPLLPIAGRPMIQHVCQRAAECGAEEVVVATDDERIVEAVRGFGGEALMTASDHQSGTDRIAEVARLRGWRDDSIVVNLQGDEPAMPASLLRQVADDMDRHPQAAVTTLGAAIAEPAQLFDPNLVKLVCDRAGWALYFSRAPIPWARDAFADGRPAELPADLPMDSTQGPPWLRHIGLYAYRVGLLHRFVGWPVAPIERIESLEQLRVLWQGERIHVSLAEVEPGHGVDTAADLARVEATLSPES